MNHILIVTMFTLADIGIKSGPNLYIQEFSSKEKCERARDYIKSQIPPIDSYSNAICVEK